MLDYSQLKEPGYYWLFSPDEREPVIVEVDRDAAAGTRIVRFFGRAEPVKLADLAGELVGPLRPHFVT